MKHDTGDARVSPSGAATSRSSAPPGLRRSRQRPWPRRPGSAGRWVSFAPASDMGCGVYEHRPPRRTGDAQVRRDGGPCRCFRKDSARTWASSATQLSTMVRFSGRRSWRGGFTLRGVTALGRRRTTFLKSAAMAETHFSISRGMIFELSRKPTSTKGVPARVRPSRGRSQPPRDRAIAKSSI
jgi:hypothetical protein